MSLTAILGIVIVVIGAGAVAEGYLLQKSYKRNGALEASNAAMVDQLKKINALHKQLDAIHSTNNALPDDKLFESLLPKVTP